MDSSRTWTLLVTLLGLMITLPISQAQTLGVMGPVYVTASSTLSPYGVLDPLDGIFSKKLTLGTCWASEAFPTDSE